MNPVNLSDICFVSNAVDKLTSFKQSSSKADRVSSEKYSPFYINFDIFKKKNFNYKIYHSEDQYKFAFQIDDGMLHQCPKDDWLLQAP